MQMRLRDQAPPQPEKVIQALQVVEAMDRVVLAISVAVKGFYVEYPGIKAGIDDQAWPAEMAKLENAKAIADVLCAMIGGDSLKPLVSGVAPLESAIAGAKANKPVR